MDDLKRFGLVAVLLLGSLLLGLAASGGLPDGTGATQRQNYTVTELMDRTPLEEDVRVPGTVSAVLDDYTAESGSTYQQFRLTDGDRAVKVFCSTSGGRVNVSTGDRVRVPGTFQEYYGEYEIFTRCSAVRIRS